MLAEFYDGLTCRFSRKRRRQAEARRRLKKATALVTAVALAAGVTYKTKR